MPVRLIEVPPETAPLCTRHSSPVAMFLPSIAHRAVDFVFRWYRDQDAELASQIALRDPFQLATPIHVCRPDIPVQRDAFYIDEKTLAFYREKQRIEEIQKAMAVKLIEQKDAKPRLVMHGKSTSLADYHEIQQMLGHVTKSNKALEVELSVETINAYKKKKDPEGKKAAGGFAFFLRRKFTANGIPATAYASGPNSVTIVPEKPKPADTKKK